MYLTKTILFASLFCLLNFSFLTINTTKHTFAQLAEIELLGAELCEIYAKGENVVLTQKNGKQIINPNEEELRELPLELFEQNRVRVSLASKSDNNLCSTELVIMGKSGQLEGNYTINACSSFGWIFFTPSNCFDINIFHDAGSEAPFGNSVHGSVEWTFKYNQQTEISGTYMDIGAARMFKVASPCYDKRSFTPLTATAAKRRVLKDKKLNF